MKHVIRINQPQFVGSTVITFDEEGKARLAVTAINESGDQRTNAEYLGRASMIHLTFAPVDQPANGAPKSLRAQAMQCYERSLPHRVAWDIVDLEPVDEDRTEYECYVLGGFRPK